MDMLRGSEARISSIRIALSRVLTIQDAGGMTREAALAQESSTEWMRTGGPSPGGSAHGRGQTWSGPASASRLEEVRRDEPGETTRTGGQWPLDVDPDDRPLLHRHRR